MGSGPASILAKEHSFMGLVLISPFTSIRNIVKEKYGRIAEIVVADNFNNQENIRKLRCPTMIVHGIKDKLVPFNHSVDLLLASKQPCHLFLKVDMAHN